MVRPFAPRDFLRLRRHQATGTPLDLETAILPGRSPLITALTGLVPWRGPSFYTLILDPSDASYPEGFLQARVHHERCDADLVFISPSLSSGPRAAVSWHRLISESGHWLGARGLRRLHVRSDPEDKLAGQVLRQLGFHDHAHETLMRLDPSPDGQTRPNEPEATPSASAKGSWLCWPEQTLDESALRAMVCDAAEQARQAQRLPLYAAAGSEKEAQRAALLDAGFEACGERIRWVRATAAHVMEPAWRETPQREPGQETAGSRSSSRIKSEARSTVQPSKRLSTRSDHQRKTRRSKA